jgi:hypothetical protein
MQDYCRTNNTDGKIARVLAEKRWPKKVLAELVTGVDDRPLVVLEEDTYLFRSYAEHQLTAADIEDLRQKRSASGAKGGRASALARANASETGKQSASKKEAESKSKEKSESLTDMTKDNESSHLPRSEPNRLDESARVSAKAMGIKDPAKVAEMLVRATKQPMTLAGAVDLAQAIMSKAKGRVTRVDAYIATVCRDTPGEVESAYFDLDIAGVA